MSHWTTVKTEIRDLTLAGEILRQAGFIVEGSSRARGYGGREEKSCALTFRAKVPFRGGAYIGGITAEGEIIADLWGFSEKDAQAITSLPQAYAKAKLQKALKTQGFTWGKEEVQPDGAIRLQVRRW